MLKSHALTTIERALEALGLVASDTPTVERLINAASSSIARELGRTVERGTIVEECMGRDAAILVLGRPPITTINWVAPITGSGGTDTALETTGYRVVDSDAGFLRRLGAHWTSEYMAHGGILGYPVEGSEVANWAVSYEGGWITPWQAHPAYPGGSLGASTLPDDLEEACLATVRARWFELRRDPFLLSQKLGDESLTYRSNAGSDSDLPDAVRAILARYTLDV